MGMLCIYMLHCQTRAAFLKSNSAKKRGRSGLLHGVCIYIYTLHIYNILYMLEMLDICSALTRLALHMRMCTTGGIYPFVWSRVA